MPAARVGMRVLSLSMVYPNPVQPSHGVFVRERLRHLADAHDVTVVAPVPWFPIASGRMANRPVGVVSRRRDGAIEVHHPRFLSPPAVGKSLDGFLYAASVWPLARRLHRERPFDLVDAHFGYPDGFAGVLLARWLGVPASVTLRGTIVDLRHRIGRRRALGWALSRADAVIAVSRALAFEAAEVGLPADRVRVIPNGIDTETFRPLDRAGCRRRLGLPAEGPVIVSVGALREVKGHHHLLAAVAGLGRERPDITLAIVGGVSVSDDRSVRLRELAAELGIDDRVVWAGRRPHEEIPLWLGAADVFALASRREGCCNALLEALACGRPVVATDVGGNPEIVASDHLGTLVPPADPRALAAGLAHVLDRHPDPDAIRSAVLERGWDRTAARVAEVWRRVVEGNVREGTSRSVPSGAATGGISGGRGAISGRGGSDGSLEPEGHR